MKSKLINYSLLLLAIAVGFIAVIPLVSIFINSFADPSTVKLNADTAKIIFLPYPISIKQYFAAILLNRETLIFFWNSVRITVPILIGGMLFALPSGYALAKFDFPFKRVIFFCYVLVMLLPIQINVVGSYIFFDKLGLIGKYISVILPGIFSSFGSFLIYQFMKKVEYSTLESARLDGANELYILIKIVIPQVKPGITSMLILMLIDCWSMVEMPMNLLKDESLYPMSIMLRYITSTNSSIIYACIIVFCIPLLLVYLITQENLTEGIAHSVPLKR